MTSLSTAPSGSQLQLAFAYDYQSRRIQKLVSTNNGTYVGEYTNKYAYDGWNCLAILNPSLVLSNSFLWGLDQSGSVQGPGGVGGLIKVIYYGAAKTNCFVAYDGNGNVSALVNAASGVTVANYEDGPFGKLLQASGPMARMNPLRFSTKYDDDESDFLYFGYRCYDPNTGRWLSKDPSGEQGGLNLYVMTANESVNLTDALGLDCIHHLYGGGDGDNDPGLHFCGPSSPPGTPKPTDPPGYNPVPVYAPLDAGKPCCTSPALLKRAARVDPSPVQGQTTKGCVNWRIVMALSLIIENPYKDLEIYWTTCWRIDKTSGVIPTCSDRATCVFPTRTCGSVGGPYVTTTRVFWLSCERGVWKVKKIVVSGGYTWDRSTWSFKTN